MRKLFSLVAFVCLSLGFSLHANAQNLTTVSASNIQDINGVKLAAGQLCFLITDQNDIPLSVQIGGGGQALRRGYCTTVVNGAVTSFTVPNPSANTLPTGTYYRVTVKDSVTGQEVLKYTQVSFTGATFNFDGYAPMNLASPAPLSGTSVTGNLSVTGNVAATGTVTASNIPANIPGAGACAANQYVTALNAIAAPTCTSTATGTGVPVQATSPTLVTPTVSGSIASTATGVGILLANTATTNAKTVQLSNTGNTGFYYGIESSAGGSFFTGSNAYESVLYTPTNNLLIRTPLARFTGTLSLNGATSGSTTLQAAAVAGSTTLTIPAATDTLVGKATTDTLTNKTIGAGGLAGLTMNRQIFTSSGTFTIPSGVTSVKVTVVGGGGGGGGGSTSFPGHGAGSGGTGLKWLIGLTPGNTLTVTVGTGGTGVSSAPGNSGGASSVASGTQTIPTITANGGDGAGTGNFGNPIGATAGTGGDLNFGGQGGYNYQFRATNPNVGGNGAPSIFGGGGSWGANGSNGGSGTAPGAGGGGGGGSVSNTTGGAGANGIVIFEWTN